MYTVWRDVFGALIIIFGLVFSVFTYISHRNSEKNREIAEESKAIAIKEVEFSKQKSEEALKRWLDALNKAEKMLDASLVALNEHLPDQAKLDINCLRFVLQLWDSDKKQRFIAVTSLGEIAKSPAVIPYLQRIADTDREIRPDAEAAIERIKNGIREKEALANQKKAKESGNTI
jgi:hypothetical protein